MTENNKIHTIEDIQKRKHQRNMIYRCYITDKQLKDLCETVFSENDKAEHLYLEEQYSWMKQFVRGDDYSAIKLKENNNTNYFIAGRNSGYSSILQDVCFIRQQGLDWFFYCESESIIKLLSYKMIITLEYSRLDPVSQMVIDFKGEIETEGLNGEDEKMALLRNATIALNEFANLALRKSPDLIKRTAENNPR